ncbi:MAG: XRE family transcriptional regulator [Gemmatimonadota bacterium]
MARRFDELRRRMAPAHRRRAHERAEEMLEELPLQELRHARKLTQEALAAALGSKQTLVSKLERRTDWYVSSLRRFIEALGGELEIVARFPDGAVKIRQFEEIGSASGAAGNRGGGAS